VCGVFVCVFVLKTPVADEAEAGRHAPVRHLRQVARGLCADPLGDLHELAIVGAEGKHARGQVKHQHADRPEVEPWRDSVAGVGLLGGPVHWRTDDLALFRRQLAWGEHSCKAEVDEFDVRRLGSHDDVGWLDVTVDHALRVHGRERLEHTAHDADCLHLGEPLHEARTSGLHGSRVECLADLLLPSFYPVYVGRRFQIWPRESCMGGSRL
jgi:hypothetical protein